MSSRSRETIIQQNENTWLTPNEIDNNEEVIDIIRKVVKQELEEDEKKFSEVLKSHVGDTNQRLNEILWEVLELTTSLDFT